MQITRFQKNIPVRGRKQLVGDSFQEIFPKISKKYPRKGTETNVAPHNQTVTAVFQKNIPVRGRKPRYRAAFGRAGSRKFQKNIPVRGRKQWELCCTDTIYGEFQKNIPVRGRKPF